MRVVDVRFEHRMVNDAIGIEQATPRISWRTIDFQEGFEQFFYETEISQSVNLSSQNPLFSTKVKSTESILVSWPLGRPLQSGEGVFVRVRVYGKSSDQTSAWSDYHYVEAGLLERADWQCHRITASWDRDMSKPQPEELYRKEFLLHSHKKVAKARLYVTAQGIYEAEINGCRIGNDFLTPGWTVYSSRLYYQTYDILHLLSDGPNCIGVRVGEGWFCGRLNSFGGKRLIWGDRTALIAQVEVLYADRSQDLIGTDGSWVVTEGPIRRGEIYDGEKYDARLEISGWSSTISNTEKWSKVEISELPPQVALLSSPGAQVRRLSTVLAINTITSPTGKLILDFGENLVGFVRVKKIMAKEGHKLRLFHAEVLEDGECARRPLRICEQLDEYICRGSEEEAWEPRFTYHGFRYVEVDGWPQDQDLKLSVEAVVCHTEMEPSGQFSCSDGQLEKLHENICRSMLGNFVSIPTDCPQRDERLGWTGDIALFSPTACYLYDCVGMLSSWLADLVVEQKKCHGIPTIVVPDVFQDGFLPNAPPAAIWADVTILLPWALYRASGDSSILAVQYDSMVAWIENIPREKNKRLWDSTSFQFGDWLDPAARPDDPSDARTDPYLVANAFLIQSLDLISRISTILGHEVVSRSYQHDASIVRQEFEGEYITKNGRLSSDTQTAYALAICFDLFSRTEQKDRAGSRLAELVRRNDFRIATGFAGTKYVCEALVQTKHEQVAYRMLLEEKCPSWLYPVTMGATTMWERWDSMLPNGTINPGDMTSFNHYAFGSIATFLHQRLAGLECIEPGWKRSRVNPVLGAEFIEASTCHLTPYGWTRCAWKIANGTFDLVVEVPAGTTMEVVLPSSDSLDETRVVAAGKWTFSVPYQRSYEWPPKSIKMFDIPDKGH